MKIDELYLFLEKFNNIENFWYINFFFTNPNISCLV